MSKQDSNHQRASAEIEEIKTKRIVSPEKEEELYKVLVDMFAHYESQDNAETGGYVKEANDIIESCPIILE